MKLRILLLPFFIWSFLGASPKEVKENFFQRNPEYSVRVFALTSPEREIETEKVVRIWHFGRLSAEDAPQEKIDSLKDHEQSMIEFWNEVKDGMKDGEFLFQVTLETEEGKIACEGFLVLGEKETLRKDLLIQNNVKLK